MRTPPPASDFVIFASSHDDRTPVSNVMFSMVYSCKIFYPPPRPRKHAVFVYKGIIDNLWIMYTFVVNRKKNQILFRRISTVLSLEYHCLFFLFSRFFQQDRLQQNTQSHTFVDWRVFYSILVHYFRIADTRVRLNRFFTDVSSRLRTSNEFSIQTDSDTS